MVGLEEYPDAPDVPETELTFEGNALLKARAIAAHTGLPAVADDSGLCVDALNGMPGIFSARWSGRHGDDEANLDLVLGQLSDVAAEHRGARFVCVAAIAWPSGDEHAVEGRMDGPRHRANAAAPTASATTRSSSRRREPYDGGAVAGGEGRHQPPRQGLPRPRRPPASLTPLRRIAQRSTSS